MKRNLISLHKRRRPAQMGFSLIELMIVILLLSVIMGSVFSQIDLVQKRFRTEQNKLDISQTAREFLDQIVRDVHKSGYPSLRLYQPSAFADTDPYHYKSYLVAVGLFYIDPTMIKFEGDLNGDGFVQNVAYKLETDTTQAGNENCPCLRRAQANKADGVDPLTWVPTYQTQVENIDPSTISTLPVFTAFDNTGTQQTISSGLTKGSLSNSWDPEDTGPSASDPINRIWTIQVQMSVRSQNTEISNSSRPEVFLTATAQMNN
jgi:prepilin-type N-terminal cleavage/methylation domain-containing protein